MTGDADVTGAAGQAHALVRQARSEIGLGLHFDAVRGLAELRATAARERAQDRSREETREGARRGGQPVPRGRERNGAARAGTGGRDAASVPPGGERGAGNRRPGILRRVGDALVLVTGADPGLVGGVHERHRYITLGCLMLLTMGAAAYGVAAVGAMGLGTSVVETLPAGIFFAIFVLMVDRSIVSQVPGIDATEPGGEPLPRRRGRRRPWEVLRCRLMTAIRAVMALLSSALVCEVILLQIFGFRIAEQMAAEASYAASLRQQMLSVSYQGQVDALKEQVRRQEHVVSALEKEYGRARRETGCQLTGRCSPHLAGAGPVYRAAVETQNRIAGELRQETTRLSALRGESQRRITALGDERTRRIRELDAMAARGADLLARERAFAGITRENGEILLWRILGTTLLFGVDLAPILFRAGMGNTLHDARLRDTVRHLKNRSMLETRLIRHLDRKTFDRRYRELQATHESRVPAADAREGARRAVARRRHPGPAAASAAETSWPPTGRITLGSRRRGGAGPSRAEVASPGAPIMVLGGRWAVRGPMATDPGTCGVLYAAYDVDAPERSVVAKVFHQASNAEPVYRTFLRELRGMRLKSPHIGEIIDSGKDPRSGAAYLISPHYQPGSLNIYVGDRNGRVSLSWSTWVLDRVLAGLECAGAERVAHLDIKPQNIVLDGPDNVRIIDWGMSRLQDDSMTHLPGGTAWFTSPEQLGDSPFEVSSASDLYGVGALAYWLLTGTPPMRREAGTDTGPGVSGARRLMESGVRPRRADRIVPGLPEELGELVDRWLSYSPPDRAPAGLSPAQALTWARRTLADMARRLPDIEVGHRTGTGDVLERKRR